MTTHPRTTRVRSALLALALIATPAAAVAQAAALPDGKTLLAEYNKALGGKDAYAKVQSVHMSGTFEMPAMGMGGTIAINSSRPSYSTMLVAVTGYGEVINGTDGKVAWSIDPQMGARLLEGAEFATAMEDAAFEAQFRDPASYRSIETLEKTTMDGRLCYKVKLVRLSGRESIECYGVDDKLLVASSEMRPGATGDIEAVSIARDYKAFDGIMLPTKMVIQVGGMEQVITFTKVELNAVPASQFEIPAAVKALIK